MKLIFAAVVPGFPVRLSQAPHPKRSQVWFSGETCCYHREEAAILGAQ